MNPLVPVISIPLILRFSFQIHLYGTIAQVATCRPSGASDSLVD